MRRIVLVLLGISALGAGAWADMRYEVIDLQKRAVRLTYEIEDNKAGNQVFYFPTGGFIHDASMGDIEVESVFDLSLKQEQPYEMTQDKETGAPQIKITYSTPIPPGGKKRLQIAVKVHMPESLLTFDSQGRYQFTYETSHAFEFIIPRNHCVVYTSHPVYIFEKGDKVFLQQMDKTLRKLVFQTRPARTP
ncbi:MAG TPA: hypothetical protein PK878_02895 [bacterium]|nr:hypothetical protein [Candidatus Omnitrophota bacterium]HOJ59209.1 hypothetical protein [bacterium]HOL94738.1 hypothetical protein [bacterium]HPO99400.1 hypothetical protein [bacterium]HXK94216.1 hypothetical protein [bacterium]